VEVQVFPAPSEEEREAIVAALAEPEDESSAWADAALREGVEADEP
jgi:hypothetical protein